ncbi:hypothetical protein T4B_14928 [Trichinella pseudospiralis]|uniref:Uncharacterized protein n=1 Tax=Trichinella pseudospiralis TaxID=6337 RepID=A0A0V1I2U9_TRIPS|nr:hypothetical protein T4A_669 [Trichinella pseudospiralis]KRZ17214.1 hypothetical protein T4B_14928 [Trichinella pseudospiralis]KRZ40536.1 hypothetical protein T4C_13793 [Trichinella pseudospiralis]
MARSQQLVDPLPCAPTGRVQARDWGQSRRRWPKLPQLKHPAPLLASSADVCSSCFTFLEIFHIKASMDWTVSVFSAFVSPVCSSRLSWKSSSA